MPPNQINASPTFPYSNEYVAESTRYFHKYTLSDVTIPNNTLHIKSLVTIIGDDFKIILIILKILISNFAHKF